jgi:hypothetical protein
MEKIKTPKIEALHRLINWLNLKNNSSFKCLGLDTSNLKITLRFKKSYENYFIVTQ